MTRRQMAATLAGLAATKTVTAALPGAEGFELIGKPAPKLGLDFWLNSSTPLDMPGLRGKVVLLRWWTQGCAYCTATAPALNEFDKQYGSRGLQIIGVYHPKPPGKWTMDDVRRAVEAKHFSFPVAVDGDWTALKRWWLTKDRSYTSVSFLVDRHGVIRYIQPGGEYHEGKQGGMPEHAACNRDLYAIRRQIERLIEPTSL